MALVSACTACGNMVVLRALCRAVPRAPAHYLLASLATADLLLGLTVLPLSAAEELYVLHIDRAWCACWRALDVLCCTASILSLCALGWERHAGVTRPLERARRATRARLVAGLVWPVSVAVAAPAAFVPFTRHHHPGEEYRACVVNTNVGYVMFSTALSFYMPAMLMLALYWRVVRALQMLPPLRSHRGGSREPQATPKSSPARWLASCKFRSPNSAQKQEKTNPAVYLSPKGNHLGAPWSYLGDMLSPSLGRSGSPLMEQSDDLRGSPRQVRATRTIVLLMSLFLACWTPFFIILPIDSVCGCVSDTALWCATWLGYANSAVNPLVYAATSPALRRALSSSGGSSTRSSELRPTSATQPRHHVPPSPSPLPALRPPPSPLLLTR